MSPAQMDASGDYEAEVAAARAALASDLDVAQRTYDAAVLAATAQYTAREQGARAQYWAARHASWTDANTPVSNGWQGHTESMPAISHGGEQ